MTAQAGCPVHGGMSFGAVMLVLIIIGLAVYCITGGIINYRQGIEVIPNAEFWRSVPTRVKQGIGITVDATRRFWAKVRGIDVDNNLDSPPSHSGYDNI